MARTGSLAGQHRVDSILLDLAFKKLQCLSTEIAGLKAAVAQLQGIQLGQSGSTLPRSVFIDADAVGPFERGFYAREYDQAGRAYRWTGDGDYIELRFFIDRSAAYHFSLAGFLPSGTSVGPIRGFVDYTPVEVEVSYDGPQLIISGSIPPAPFESRATLTLWSPNHAVTEPSADSRTLWFVFSTLSVTPSESSEAVNTPLSNLVLSEQILEREMKEFCTEAAAAPAPLSPPVDNERRAFGASEISPKLIPNASADQNPQPALDETVNVDLSPSAAITRAGSEGPHTLHPDDCPNSQAVRSTSVAPTEIKRRGTSRRASRGAEGDR